MKNIFISHTMIKGHIAHDIFIINFFCELVNFIAISAVINFLNIFTKDLVTT